MLELRHFKEYHRDVKVGVMMGGTSSEREVSLNSGRAILEALEQAGFQVRPIVLDANALPDTAREFDVIFPALHGGFGEDGGIQDLLDDANIVYVGSGPQASRIIMDKTETKAVLRGAGLPVPGGRLLNNSAETFPEELRFPVVVKPNSGGSSVGMSIVRNPHEWGPALSEAFREEPVVLVEQLLRGQELTVGLIDGEPLTPVEIVPPGDFYDYDAKYTYAFGQTQYFCPPHTVTDDRWDELKDIARDAYHVLGARDLLRVDLMLDKPHGRPKILEANSIPGFTATSLLPKAAGEAGISFEQLCTHLVLTALERNR